MHIIILLAKVQPSPFLQREQLLIPGLELFAKTGQAIKIIGVVGEVGCWYSIVANTAILVLNIIWAIQEGDRSSSKSIALNDVHKERLFKVITVHVCKNKSSFTASAFWMSTLSQGVTLDVVYEEMGPSEDQLDLSVLFWAELQGWQPSCSVILNSYNKNVLLQPRWKT